MKKAHIKAILKKDKANAQNEYPIFIRTTLNRKRTLASIGGYRAKENQFNEKTGFVKDNHPEADLINTIIMNMCGEVHDEYKNHVANGSAKTVKVSDLVRKKVKDTAWVRGDTNFYNYVRDRIIHMEKTNEVEAATLPSYTAALNNMKKHLGNPMMFSDLNPDLLDKLKRKMMEKGRATTTIKKTMIDIRKFTNLALDRGLINVDPFKGFVMPVGKSKTKARLTIAELDRLERYASGESSGGRRTLKDGTMSIGRKKTALYFLLACYTGFRWSDWDRFDLDKHITEDGIMGFYAKKNKNLCMIPMHDRLENVIRMIRELPPVKISYRYTLKHIDEIEKELKLGKHLTTHCGRKTFAVTVCSEFKIMPETCAEMMGISLLTCLDNYYEVTPERIKSETDEKWVKLRRPLMKIA